MDCTPVAIVCALVISVENKTTKQGSVVVAVEALIQASKGRWSGSLQKIIKMWLWAGKLGIHAFPKCSYANDKYRHLEKPVIWAVSWLSFLGRCSAHASTKRNVLNHMKLPLSLVQPMAPLTSGSAESCAYIFGSWLMKLGTMPGGYNAWQSSKREAGKWICNKQAQTAFGTASCHSRY